jgi:hypothetical protein
MYFLIWSLSRLLFCVVSGSNVAVALRGGCRKAKELNLSARWIKAHRGSGGRTPLILYIAIRSRSGLFRPSVKAPSTHSTAGWVGPRRGPNVSEKKYISFAGIQIPNRPSPGPVTGKISWPNAKLSSLGDSSPLCSMYTSKDQRFTSQNTTIIMDIYFI